MNVTKRDPEKQINIRAILDKNIKLPYTYQSKVQYDSLIQNIILKEITNLLGSTILNSDRKLKMKISRMKYLECRLL